MKSSYSKSVGNDADFPRQFGFTLIELMITLVVAAILAALAYAEYTRYVIASHRATAVAALYENAQFMERVFTSNSSYLLADGTAPQLPVLAVPRDGVPSRYLLTLTNVTALTYTLTAVRQPPQLHPSEQCVDLLINQTGTRNRTGTQALEQCWTR
jgi:type IV pilus assembly protein PilE